MDSIQKASPGRVESSGNTMPELKKAGVLKLFRERHTLGHLAGSVYRANS